MADILARCRGVARRSPEAHRHTVAGITVAGITLARIGVVAIGAAAIGVAIGVIIIIVASLVTSSSFSAGLVFRSSGILIMVTIRTITGTATAMVIPTGMIITAGPLTDTVTATAIKGTAMAIKGTATAIKDTAMAIDRGSRSCRGASRGLATTAAPLMASWDHKPGAPFALTNVRMVN